MQSMADIPIVQDVRAFGLLGGIDLAPGNAPGARGLAVTQELYAAGLMIKLTGDCALLSPPFVSEEKHIDEIFTKLRGVLSKQ